MRLKQIFQRTLFAITNRPPVVAGLFIVFTAAVAGQQSYEASVKQWRTDHEEEIKGDNGWLTVVGLFWLKEGRNTIGAGPGHDIELTDNFKGTDFGEIQFNGSQAFLTVRPGIPATVGDKVFSSGEILSDEKGKPTTVRMGSQSFFLIKRDKRFAIRVKDANSKERRGFAGLDWYAIDPAYRVIGRFERYQAPRDVLVPNVLGGEFKMKSPGVIKFILKSRQVTLEAIDEGDGRLFIIFRDLTSQSTTDAAGRFLYADWPGHNGNSVVLDFNKAENPPCAFTTFATCPLPRQQNRLLFAIPAGEKRYSVRK
jgi:uncharacterized protein (DUF1684 family)